MESKPEVPWKWFVGMSPSIGWDMAFQTKVEKAADIPERIEARRISKVEVAKNDVNKPELRCISYMPAHFGAIDGTSEGILDRKLFVFIIEATPAAAADWDKTWENPASAQKKIVEADNVDMEEAAKVANLKAKAVEALRKDPRNLLTRVPGGK